MLSFITPAVAGKVGLAMNLSILPLNHFFTRTDNISILNPTLWSAEGQACVVLWGAAYHATGVSDTRGPLWLVFALEKALFACCWARYMLKDNGLKKLMTAVAKRNSLAIRSSLFHCIYGIVDIAGALMFLKVFLDQ